MDLFKPNIVYLNEVVMHSWNHLQINWITNVFVLLLVMIQEDYRCQNPYHNAVHAADVTQAMYCYLQEPKVRKKDMVYH